MVLFLFMKKILLLTAFVFIIIILVVFIFIKISKNGIEIDKENKIVLQKEYEIKEQLTVPILIYHNIRDFKPNESATDMQYVVSAENFEKQMKYLSENGFQTILMRDLYYYFEGEKDLPKNSVIINFDDGVVNQYESAFPILKKYNQVATFFVFTNAMDRNVNYINWAQLAEMVDGGMEIGSHTNLHPFLTKIADNKLMEKEIKGSKDEIESRLGVNVLSFAYPFGEYNESIKQPVKDTGYFVARGIKNGKEHSKENLYDLRAYFVTNDFERFKKLIE